MTAPTLPAIDGDSRRYSPLGDSRERTVLCRMPGCRRRTIAFSAVCDDCDRGEAS